MAGVNANTGEVLDGFDHVQQSLSKIFSTPQGQRVMREWFGNPGLKVLGRNQTEETILLFFNVISMLIDLFEPRFRIIQFDLNDITRLGETAITANGEYRPYAQLDWVQSKSFLSINGTTVTLSGAL
jgi:phage baseplate assembly protein W